MSNKYDELNELVNETSKTLTRSKTSWTKFLETSARLYKYPYFEQLQIFSQRPDVTACADFSVWNETMNRYIKRGSKGIALIDTENGDTNKVKYVFDVSDTAVTPKSKDVNLWIYSDEAEKTVMERLSERYNTDEKNLISTIALVSMKLSEDYWDKHGKYASDILAGSFLEEYDEDNIGMQFRKAVSVSSTYMSLFRCGIDPNLYLDNEDFSPIFDFNTRESTNYLGSAVSEISEQILRHIEIAVKSYERSKQNERTEVQEERRLPDSRSESSENRVEADRQIRQNENELPQREHSVPLEQIRPRWNAESPFKRGKRPSRIQTGNTHRADEETERSNGTDESNRPDEMGRTDEFNQGPGRGNSPERDSFRINEPEETEQLSLFPSEEEQIEIIN